MSRAVAVDPADDATVRELAAEILRRTEYARWRSFDEAGWMESLSGGVGSLFEWLFALPIRHPTLYWALEVGLLVIAALLVAYVGRSIRAATRETSVRRSASVAASRRDWLRDADAAAHDGRYLDAAHSLQIATLESLLRSGRISLARSEPNRVLRERLRRAQLDEPLRERLLSAIGRLEAAWFRGDRADPLLYADWRSLYSEVAGAAGRAGADR